MVCGVGMLWRRRLFYAGCFFAVFLVIYSTLHGTSSVILSSDFEITSGSNISSLTDPPPPPAPPRYNVTATQILRKRQIKETCQKLEHRTNDGNDIIENLEIDHHYKVMYCVVPKAACTTTKRVMRDLADRGPSINRVFIKLSEVRTKMKDYFKFMFVREPMERLVSAYRNQLEQTNLLANNFGRNIVKMYRANATKKALAAGNDATFLEFSRYVADEKPSNIHWMTYQRLCRPCQVDYDFIGKYETLEEDLKYVIPPLYNVTDVNALNIPHINPTLNGSSLSVLSPYMSLLPKSIIEKLCKIYSIDSKMFNYSPVPCAQVG